MEDQEREFTGVFIPDYVFNDEDLSSLDIIVYINLICLLKPNSESLEYISRKLRIKRYRLLKIVERLQNKGYINISK